MGALNMFIVFIYLFSAFVCTHMETKYLNESSVYRNIQASIGQLCPFSNICGWNTRPDDIPNDVIPCCRDCSCNDTCEELGNCCFPDQAASVIKETEQTTQSQCGLDCRLPLNQDSQTSPNTDTALDSCIFPAVLDQTVIDYIYPALQLYKMITKCPSTSSTASEYDVDNTHQSLEKGLDCGDRNVASWGSLLPVYSQKNNLIYKNSFCATCHNVTDGLVWDVKQTCIDDGKDVSDIMQDFTLQHTEELLCNQMFLHPGKWIDIEHLRCYNNIIEKCSNGDFVVPSYINLTAKDIFSACERGLYSPINGIDEKDKRKTYKNVYCAVCNSARIEITGYCKNNNLYLDLRFNGRRFTFILKGSLVIENKNVNTESGHVVCPLTEINTKNSSGCRKLLCPSGQMRLDGDRCQFPATLWHSPLSICLELNPLQDIPLDVFEELAAKNIDTWLVSAWIDSWTLHELVYQIYMIDQKKLLKRLFVHMTYKYLSYNIDRQLRYVKSILSSKWKIKINDTMVIKMNQSLSGFCNFFFSPFGQPCGLPRFDYYKLLDNGTNVEMYVNQSHCNYKIIKRDMQRNWNMILTKQYFCNRVQLDSSEFQLEARNEILYNKLTNKIFLPNEFSITAGQLLGQLEVRLCVDDAGFEAKVSTNNSKGYPVDIILILLLALQGIDIC